jgi:hypothetical protein
MLWAGQREGISTGTDRLGTPLPVQHVSYLKGVTNEDEISTGTDRLGTPLPVQHVSYLKGVTNEKGGGWGKDANVGYWS